VRLRSEYDPPTEASSSRTHALCLIDSTLDDMLHNATLGAADALASVELWLSKRSLQLENMLDELLGRGFAVFLASDHGHVEARGMGQPSEGLTVQTRCKRARVYDDRLAAARVQQGFTDTVLWESDGLLPDGVCALMPKGRSAFAPFGETAVTHGGLTLEEIVVPLVKMTV